MLSLIISLLSALSISFSFFSIVFAFILKIFFNVYYYNLVLKKFFDIL